MEKVAEHPVERCITECWDELNRAGHSKHYREVESRKRGLFPLTNELHVSKTSGVIAGMTLATGLERKDGETFSKFARRCLEGRKVMVLGARYGGLMRDIAHFGADVYGVDSNGEAVEHAIKIGAVEAGKLKTGKSSEIRTLFLGLKPDFFVSYDFLHDEYIHPDDTPDGWETEQEMQKTVRAMHALSTESTLHVHGTTMGMPLRVKPEEYGFTLAEEIPVKYHTRNTVYSLYLFQKRAETKEGPKKPRSFWQRARAFFAAEP